MPVQETTCSIHLSPRDNDPNLYKAEFITDDVFQAATAHEKFLMMSAMMFQMSIEFGRVLAINYSQKEEHGNSTIEGYIKNMAKDCTEDLVELVVLGGKLAIMEMDAEVMKIFSRSVRKNP